RRRPRLPGFAGCRGQSHPHHHLWQGTSGGRVRRHFLLVAEPPCRHHAGRRRQLSAVAEKHHKRRPLRSPFFVLRRNQNLAEVSHTDKRRHATPAYWHFPFH